MKIKALITKAVAHYHTPTSNQYNRMAERLTRLMVSWELGAEAFKLARSERSELVHLVKAQLDPIEKNLRQVRRTNEQTERLTALDAKALLPIKRPSSTLVRPKPVPNLFEPDQFADCDLSKRRDSDFSDGLVDVRRVSAAPTGRPEIVEDDEMDSLLSSLKESPVLEDDGFRTLTELSETASNLLAEMDVLVTSVLAQSAPYCIESPAIWRAWARGLLGRVSPDGETGSCHEGRICRNMHQAEPNAF